MLKRLTGKTLNKSERRFLKLKMAKYGLYNLPDGGTTSKKNGLKL